MRSTSSGFALSLLLAASACGTEADDAVLAPASPAEGRSPGTLSWQPCGIVECATLEVPISYDEPSLGTVSLALSRARANTAQRYRGAVLVNPGGPGASGKQFVTSGAGPLRDLFPGFDFIGFDPRGVGESDALGCTIRDEEVGRGFLEGGASGYLSALRAESLRCAEEAGPLFANMGSNQVVADIERMREALGEEQINFLGISYGTRLGELYALVYPERARAVILDAPLSPVADTRAMAESQFAALLELHESFFEDCDAGLLDCPEEPERAFEAWIEAGRRSGQALNLAGVWKGLLVSPQGRDRGALLLRVVAGEAPPELPAGMPATADLLPGSGVNVAASLSINCADEGTPPLGPDAAQALLDSFSQRSSVFATDGLPALSCSAWEVPRDPVPSIEFQPRVPPLVIGGTQDLLTPYALARETVQLLQGAALLTSEHYGHSAVSFGSLCVFRHLRTYLETLELPPADARCEPPPTR